MKMPNKSEGLVTYTTPLIDGRKVLTVKGNIFDVQQFCAELLRFNQRLKPKFTQVDHVSGVALEEFYVPFGEEV